MPIALPKPLKVRLVEQIATELEKATVIADCYISPSSIYGISGVKSLPDKGAMAEQLHQFIGDNPLWVFVKDELDHSFKGPGANLDAVATPLVNYEGYADLSRVAAELVESFSSLPWDYRLTVKLPNSLSAVFDADLGSIDLSPCHRIIPGSTLHEEFPVEERPRGLVEMMLGKKPPPLWDVEGVYLQIAMSGYFRSEQTEPLLAARDDVLTFFGLGIALDLFDEKPFDINDIDGKATHFYVHRLGAGAWMEQCIIDIDDKHKQVIGRVGLARVIRDSPELIREKLDRIGTVFRSSAGKNIALSARWLFESHCNRDALLQYIQAAVAIEILLGDEEADPNVGLTTLMANRCAFLIAKTPDARTNLLKLFRDIYKVRSKIVHRGKSRLNARENGLFGALQEILSMVIDKEQRLLERAAQNRKG